MISRETFLRLFGQVLVIFLPYRDQFSLVLMRVGPKKIAKAFPGGQKQIE